MDNAVLLAELTDDPLGRGYSGMTDEEAATDLNTVYREVNVTSVSGQDLVEATATLDYDALDAAQLQEYWGICGMGEILVNATNTKNKLLAMFGPGTDTRANLAVLQKTTISRTAELELGTVAVGHVQRVRA